MNGNKKNKILCRYERQKKTSEPKKFDQTHATGIRYCKYETPTISIRKMNSGNLHLLNDISFNEFANYIRISFQCCRSRPQLLRIFKWKDGSFPVIFDYLSRRRWLRFKNEKKKKENTPQIIVTNIFLKAGYRQSRTVWKKEHESSAIQ